MRYSGTMLVLLILGLPVWAQTNEKLSKPSFQRTEASLSVVVHFYREGDEQDVSMSDATGRIVGRDVLSRKTYPATPGTFYDVEGQGDLDNISHVVAKSIRFDDAATGEYVVTVTAKRAQRFVLFVAADCSSEAARKQLLRQTIAANTRRSFVIHFNQADCSALTVSSVGAGRAAHQ